MGFFYKPRGSDSKPSKEAAQGGGEPPATGMARDYDYLFKLLIIGDSGKPTPGMRDGKWALWGFFLQGEENKCSSVATVYFYDAFTTYHFSFSSCKMIGEMYTSAIFLWR